MKTLMTIIIFLLFLSLIDKIANHDIEIKTLKNEVNDLHTRIEELEFKDTNVDEFVPYGQQWQYYSGITNNSIKQ